MAEMRDNERSPIHEGENPLSRFNGWDPRCELNCFRGLEIHLAISALMSCEAGCKDRRRGKEPDRRMKSALFGGQSCVELTIPQMTTQRSGMTGAGFLCSGSASCCCTDLL